MIHQYAKLWGGRPGPGLQFIGYSTGQWRLSLPWEAQFQLWAACIAPIAPTVTPTPQSHCAAALLVVAADAMLSLGLDHTLYSVVQWLYSVQWRILGTGW